MVDEDAERTAAVAEQAVTKQLTRTERLVQRYGSVARIVLVIVGVVLLAIGIALLIFPGPGWAVIFLGLATLAASFPRLQGPLLAAVRAVGRAAGKVRKSPPLIALATVVVLAIAGALIYFIVLR